MQTDTCLSDTSSVPQSHVLDYSVWLFALIVTTPFQNRLHQSQGPDELFSGWEIETRIIWLRRNLYSSPGPISSSKQSWIEIRACCSEPCPTKSWISPVLEIPHSLNTFSTAELCSQWNIFSLCLFRISLALAPVLCPLLPHVSSLSTSVERWNSSSVH